MTISDKDFLDFLNDKSDETSEELRLRAIIDEELEKPESKTDTELLEYCIDVLNALEKERRDGKSKSRSTVVFTDGQHQYVVSAHMNLKQAISLAKTIK